MVATLGQYRMAGPGTPVSEIDALSTESQLINEREAASGFLPLAASGTTNLPGSTTSAFGRKQTRHTSLIWNINSPNGTPLCCHGPNSLSCGYSASPSQ